MVNGESADHLIYLITITTSSVFCGAILLLGTRYSPNTRIPGLGYFSGYFLFCSAASLFHHSATTSGAIESTLLASSLANILVITGVACFLAGVVLRSGHHPLLKYRNFIVVYLCFLFIAFQFIFNDTSGLNELRIALTYGHLILLLVLSAGLMFKKKDAINVGDRFIIVAIVILLASFIFLPASYSMHKDVALYSGMIMMLLVINQILALGGILIAYLIDASDRYQQTSTTDYLSGLANRDHFIKGVITELARIKRSSGKASLVMIDIDDFKQINDLYGHGMGDLAIRRVAESISNAIRDVDLAGRLSGEEFAVLLPDTDVEGAQILANRILESVRNTMIDDGSRYVKLTASLGVSEISQDSSIDSLLRAADKAMSLSKTRGKNQVTISS